MKNYYFLSIFLPRVLYTTCQNKFISFCFNFKHSYCKKKCSLAQNKYQNVLLCNNHNEQMVFHIKTLFQKVWVTVCIRLLFWCNLIGRNLLGVVCMSGYGPTLSSYQHTFWCWLWRFAFLSETLVVFSDKGHTFPN